MKKIALFTAALMASASPAYAATIVGLYDTGVATDGTVLPTGSTDTHYLVNGLPSYVTNNGAYYQSSTAAFIASQPGGAGGSQTYKLNFTVSDLTNAMLSGNVAYDNGVIVQLNGNVLYTDIPTYPGTTTAFNTLHGFSASAADFVTGNNVLSFSVIDYTAPTGLLVSGLKGTAGAVPEPATWAMMMLGFGMIGFGLRSRRKQSVRVTYA